MEMVQEIASSCTEELPPEFIRPENEQPRFTTFRGRQPDVPVVDFGVPEEKDLVQPVFDASSRWGLFQIVNHGIPDEVIENLQRVGRLFFELPQEEKEVYAKDPTSKSVEGYGTKLNTKGACSKEIKGWVDHLFNKIWPPSAVDRRFWPRNPPDYRAAVEEYAKHLHEVVNKLLRCLSLGLGLAADELKAAVGGTDMVYNMKINYYPPCPQPELALGVPAHSDLCAITILVPNEVQGLQMHRDGHWYDVGYIPNALIVHIGDQIEILSNGRCKAVVHRSTVNKERTRMSWPVFIEPPPDLEIGPYPNLVNDESPSKYKTKKFSDYAYCKLNKIPQ
ncbi:Iron ascorbate-dependent oxidoreductase [Orobanche hederae]